MKKYLAGILLTLLLIFIPVPVFAKHIASPTGHVNDFAGVLSQEQKAEIETQLTDYENQTSNEIAIAFVKSLEGDTIEEFAVRTFEEWKIGKKGSDNGLLFIAAIDDRKMRIEVGYGLEPYITDSQAGTIIRETISPKFKTGNYYQGTKDGLLAIESTISGENPSSAKVVDLPQTSRGVLKILEFALIFGFIVFPYFFAYLARTKSFWLGGVSGGLLGFVLGLLASSVLLGSILLIVFGAIGLILDFVLSKIYQTRRNNGDPTDWWNSGGGFFPSSGSGSSSSGGFGGFGGGSSGGGGASGGW